MSQFKPNSNIFVKTTSDDMAEMGFVTMCREGMTNIFEEEMDYAVYILLSHGPMAFMDLVESIRTILNSNKGTVYIRVMDSIQRLNNDKQRIAKDGAFYHLTVA